MVRWKVREEPHIAPCAETLPKGCHFQQYPKFLYNFSNSWPISFFEEVNLKNKLKCFGALKMIDSRIPEILKTRPVKCREMLRECKVVWTTGWDLSTGSAYVFWVGFCQKNRLSYQLIRIFPRHPAWSFKSVSSVYFPLIWFHFFQLFNLNRFPILALTWAGNCIFDWPASWFLRQKNRVMAPKKHLKFPIQAVTNSRTWPFGDF